MNYLAHARHALDDPWRLAGTALPDWLRRLHRRLRIPDERLDTAAPGSTMTLLVAGIREHHEDDRWFHQSRGFLESTATITRRLRSEFPDAPGFRASFTAHLLVEMLLDHEISERRPGALDRYYDTIDSLDLEQLETNTATLVGRSVDGLAKLVRVFWRIRFLADYGTDSLVVERLNGVQERVRLNALPGGFTGLLPEFRKVVRENFAELLPETADSN